MELFCGRVWPLKATVMLGTTTWSFPLRTWCTQHLGLPGLVQGAVWLPAVLRDTHWFQFAIPAAGRCCSCHLGLCLPCFICPALPVPPRVSLPSCHRQVVSLHACRTPEVGRTRSERAEMAGSVYQTGRIIRYSIPHCLPKPAFSDGFPDV